VCYLSCPVRVVLAHPFRALTTFAVRFCILIFTEDIPLFLQTPNKSYRFLSFTPGQTELTWVQNCPAWFEEKSNTRNTIYALHNDNFVSRGFKVQREKLVRFLLCTTVDFYCVQPWIFTLYNCGFLLCTTVDFLKKRPTLSTFCTHSVIRRYIFMKNLRTEDVSKCIQPRQNRWASIGMRHW
jgi:hypothetical protein